MTPEEYEKRKYDQYIDKQQSKFYDKNPPTIEEFSFFDEETKSQIEEWKEYVCGRYDQMEEILSNDETGNNLSLNNNNHHSHQRKREERKLERDDESDLEVMEDWFENHINNPDSVYSSNISTNLKRDSLPCWEMKNEILNTILKREGEDLDSLASQVTIISGETGCGKSTQIPQYLIDDMIQQQVETFRVSNDQSPQQHEKQPKLPKIIITQPRRISAMSVSERVCHERGVRMGLR